MIWVLLGLVLIGTGSVVLLLRRRTSASTDVRPPPVEQTRPTPADRARERLDRALAAVVARSDAGEDLAADYAGAAARLTELFQVHLGRTPSASALRFARFSSRVADTTADARDPHADELAAVDAAMRGLRLGRADVEPMGIEPYEHAVERYTSGRLQRAGTARVFLVHHLQALGAALRSVRSAPGADLAAEVDRHVDRLLDALATDAQERARRHRAAFQDVRAAADRVTVEVAQSLVSPHVPTPLVAVSARAAVLLVGERAAGHLERQVAEIVPLSGAADDSAAGDELASDRSDLLLGMDRNAAALAAVDGVVMAVLGTASADTVQVGLGQCVAGCAAIPPELTGAVADLAVYLQSSDFDDAVQRVVEEFLPKLAHDLLPGVSDSPHGEGMVAVLAGVHHAVKQVQHSLLAELVTNANPAIGGLKFVGYQVLGSAEDLGDLAAESPVVMEAVRHVETAAHALGDALGPAVEVAGLLAASHLPFVTLIRSTKREIARHREYGTTVGEGLGQVVLDVGGIWVGVGAAAGAAAVLGLHGGPAVLVTVPGAVAGSLATRRYKQWRLAKATEAFELAKEDHAATVDRLHREFSAAVDGWLLRGRDRCAALPGAPRPPDVAALVGELAVPMRTYRVEVEEVLAAADRIRASGGADRTARAALAQAEAALADGPNGHARALELAAIPVPLPPGWGPSREFARHCAFTARRLRDGADEHHTRFAHWVHRANTLVQSIRSDVEARVEGDVATLERGRDAARQLVDLAAREVEVRASALGRRRPAQSWCPAPHSGTRGP